jgi:putative PIN family toxin of toxin-antitoxin system
LIIPLINKATLEELQRVLSYPKFQLESHEISELIDNYLLYAQFVEESLETPELPHCTDRDDQKFLILAAVGKATVLLTGDKALLNLTGQTSFAIETPQTFYQRLEKMRLLKPEDNSS